ncbi:hypothetical protein CEUSTIGMA_g1065.t1 [Chlamydomonas eustigma]|uniref:30S ribosomal protein S15 n=1 Tax=Chlamydomonas eustigma TaxID=1157962 RepID=A0A250WRZ2_9CHLO|nr:hypothetical protein CEUSTIGMA_g1065.t1 [Chlamydomonas eustigma]|eukprot:GAX73614.1 hypothetical protein CEUSTIGMA_g1065.t1 [Chlamydomonas eustigma]
MALSMISGKRVAPFSGATSRIRTQPVRAPVVISQSYQNKENINLSKVSEYARHEKDTGSPEYQVSRLNARIEQLGKHLKYNRKDFSALRGLQAILAQRRSLLQYLYRVDREGYYKLIQAYGIRSVVVGDTRGTSREKVEKAAA